jgi:hypothetical protein
MGRILFIPALFIMTVSAKSTLGVADSNDLEQLNARILELQQRIDEMQEEHSSDIRAMEQQINELAAEASKRKTQDALAALRELAKAKAAEKVTGEKESEETTFKSGGLSLQALNPEISVTGDFLFSARDDATREENSDFEFRNLGVHLESWLDPYSRFKSAVEFSEDETELGEAYLNLYNFSDDLNLTLGKFRQQFGIVNRWHKHGLDQVDFPVALRKIFGEGGLDQTGVSLDWMMPPLGQSSQQTTLQVTDGSNERLFDGNSKNRPSILAHYRNYRDLSKDTYLEWGLSGLIGWNDQWDMLGGIEQTSSKETFVLGADLSLLWEPTSRMRYRNIEWRSEAYWLNQEALAPDGSGADTINAWGLYSYLQTKISRAIDIGVRGDFYRPDTKAYANLSGPLSLSPLAVTHDHPHLWQVGPYITFWQSPFVKFRAEYDYSDGRGIEAPEHVVWLQAIFAAGPHKHERY